jgi:hypothetical protein
MNDRMNSSNIYKETIDSPLFFFFPSSFSPYMHLPANESEDMRMGENSEWESGEEGVDRSRDGPVRGHRSIIFYFLALLQSTGSL